MGRRRAPWVGPLVGGVFTAHSGVCCIMSKWSAWEKLSSFPASALIQHYS